MAKMHSSRHPQKKDETSWEKVSDWYNQIVSKEGHYFHQEVIFPKLLELLKGFTEFKNPSVIDLACGQGVLSRVIPESWNYTGIDISSSFIKIAKAEAISKKHGFFEGDICLPQEGIKGSFSFGTIILALQNLINPLGALQNAKKFLCKDGIFVAVLNHPCFRIPRQSAWGVDEAKKLQYRRIDSYMSEVKIPIHTAPSKGDKSPVVYSFHHNLSFLTKIFYEAGFQICFMEEWCSNKSSDGKNAKMENRSRQEFPLFLTIVARAL